jgi:UDP-N-acetylglucosamine acyltransferase
MVATQHGHLRAAARAGGFHGFAGAVKHAHIGHDCVIKNGVTISCGAKIGGHTIIKENSNIGLNAVLHQWEVIEEGCMIGASAFFKGQSEAFSKYAGVPAKKIGSNLK